jgi:hypothetical protein
LVRDDIKQAGIGSTELTFQKEGIVSVTSRVLIKKGRRRDSNRVNHKNVTRTNLLWLEKRIEIPEGTFNEIICGHFFEAKKRKMQDKSKNWWTRAEKEVPHFQELRTEFSANFQKGMEGTAGKRRI